MRASIHLSAKELSEIVSPDFCPRCFWIKLHMRHKLPFQPPQAGIYFAMEGYCRRLIYHWFDAYHRPPPWLAHLGDLEGYRPLAHHKQPFLDMGLATDPEHGITLHGSPGGALMRPDQSYLLVDYKVARYTKVQQRLFPMYAARLNAYAWIGPSYRLTPVSGLALVYLEPVTGHNAVTDTTRYREDGFGVDFTATVFDVPLDEDTLISLFAQTRELYDRDPYPEERAGCKDCTALNHLLDVISQ